MGSIWGTEARVEVKERKSGRINPIWQKAGDLAEDLRKQLDLYRIRMTKFLVDSMLGKLVKELRKMGYDALYYRGRDFHELLQMARQQERIILTRNTRLTAKGVEGSIILIAEDHPLLQVKELLRKGIIGLDEKAVFSRCLLCNSLLGRIAREEVEGKVPDFIFYQHNEFHQCPRCHQIYWPGSHQQRMEKRLRDLTGVQGIKDSSDQAK